MADAHQIAKIFNLTAQRVHQLVKLGMPKTGRGQFDVGPCMQWYIKYLQEELRRRGPAGTAANASMSAAREGLTVAQKARVEIDNAVTLGELVVAEDVRKHWTVLVSNAQKRLRALPAAVGPQLTNLSDPAVIVARMKHEIDAALKELAGDGVAQNAAAAGREAVGAAS